MGLFDIFQGRENHRGWDSCSWVHLHIGRVRDKIMLNVFGLFGNTDRSCKYMKNREKGQTSAEMIKMVRYETTAAALNFTTYLLACNPDVQVDVIWSLRRPDQKMIFFPFVLFNWNRSDYHLSNYRCSHLGSPSTRDWRLPGKLCQLNNNFCNQIQISFVEEDQSKYPESKLCLIFLRGQMANQTMTTFLTSNIWIWWFCLHLYMIQTNDKCLNVYKYLGVMRKHESISADPAAHWSLGK